MPILEFQNVSKVYDAVTKALTDVSFSVDEGEFVAIIGPSGSGKSTILRCINRLVDATQGTITFDGHLITPPDKSLAWEPTASLDNKTKTLVRDMLKKLKEMNTSMIGIFHDIEFMDGVCDRVYNISEGTFAV